MFYVVLWDLNDINVVISINDWLCPGGVGIILRPSHHMVTSTVHLDGSWAQPRIITMSADMRHRRNVLQLMASDAPTLELGVPCHMLL